MTTNLVTRENDGPSSLTKKCQYMFMCGTYKSILGGIITQILHMQPRNCKPVNEVIYTRAISTSSVMYFLQSQLMHICTLFQLVLHVYDFVHCS